MWWVQEADSYAHTALKAWNWMKANGIIRSDWTMWDGVNPGCMPHMGPPLWTYNQV